MNNICHNRYIRLLAMILKTSICFIRKMLECRMYFICTETGAVVFQPEALPQAESIAENENE
jgi:hypothetical protein